MKQLAKIICIAALSVAAYGCGQPTTETPPDATTVKPPDGGPTCAAAKKCGTDCCGADQECVDGVCTDCECTTDNWKCGTDSCGNECGTCTSPMVCSATLHECKNPGDLCTGHTCTGETPDCNAADGACKCNNTSCTGGKTCNATTGKCEGGTPACTATQTECGTGAAADCCDNATEKCMAGVCKTCGCGSKVCGEDACGNKCGANNGECTGTDKCNANGECKAAGQLCEGVTCAQTGEACDATDGQCYCTVGGAACANGFECKDRKCTPVAVACAGLNCTTEEPCNATANKCECTANSCTGGKTCNLTTKKCETVSTGCTSDAQCSGETPHCNTTTSLCECTSAACTAVGKTCDATTKKCVTGGGCTNCTQGETCNTATNTCECKVGTNTVQDSCNKANASFMCDATSKKCVSTVVTCNGVTCEPGQVCADLNSTDPLNGPNKSCTCLPSLENGFIDSCLYMGKACNYYTDPPFKCEKPSQFDECTTWSGCDTTYNPNLTCEGLGSAGNIYLCVQKCTATSSCPGLTQKCTSGYMASSKICYFNQCAQPQAPSTTPNRSAYFKPCASAGASDGICLPLWSTDDAGNPIDDGYCFQTGSATADQKCDPFATRQQPTLVCAQGHFCDITRYDGDTAGTFTGVCREVCNAAEGATGITPTPVDGCQTAGQKCRDNWLWEALYGQDLQNIYTNFPYSLLGFCVPGCDVTDNDPACPAKNGAGDDLGCQLYDFSGATGEGTCEALQATVAKEGEACINANDELEPDDGSYRNNCENGTFCSSQGGKCVGFCSTATCAAGQPCAECVTGTTCVPGDTGWVLGICQ